MSLFYTLDLLGTVAFAMSGTLAAIEKKLDPFGVFIIAFVTAVGGGTMRDLLIGSTPVGWMHNLNYVYAIIGATIFTIIARNKMAYLRKSLFLFDSVGLGVFTILGTEVGIRHNMHPIIGIALGTMTATFGGVIRDILCNDIPIIFRREIYAVACVLGAAIYLVMFNLQLDTNFIYVVTISIIIIVRLVAVKYSFSLLTFYKYR